MGRRQVSTISCYAHALPPGPGSHDHSSWTSRVEVSEYSHCFRSTLFCRFTSGRLFLCLRHLRWRVGTSIANLHVISTYVIRPGKATSSACGTQGQISRERHNSCTNEPYKRQSLLSLFPSTHFLHVRSLSTINTTSTHHTTVPNRHSAHNAANPNILQCSHQSSNRSCKGIWRNTADCRGKQRPAATRPSTSTHADPHNRNYDRHLRPFRPSSTPTRRRSRPADPKQPALLLFILRFPTSSPTGRRARPRTDRQRRIAALERDQDGHGNGHDPQRPAAAIQHPAAAGRQRVRPGGRDAVDQRRFVAPPPHGLGLDDDKLRGAGGR